MQEVFGTLRGTYLNDLDMSSNDPSAQKNTSDNIQKLNKMLNAPGGDGSVQDSLFSLSRQVPSSEFTEQPNTRVRLRRTLLKGFLLRLPEVFPDLLPHRPVYVGREDLPLPLSEVEEGLFARNHHFRVGVVPVPLRVRRGKDDAEAIVALQDGGFHGRHSLEVAVCVVETSGELPRRAPLHPLELLLTAAAAEDDPTDVTGLKG